MIQPDIATMLSRIDAPAQEEVFDPEHPDAEILEDFDKYRRLKTWAYAQEDVQHGDWPGDDCDRVDAVVTQLENGVLGNYPTTPIAAALQLFVVLPSLDPARELDRDLVEVGILPFGSGPHDLALGWSAKQIITTAYALFDMEWELALKDYRRSVADLNLALEVQGKLETSGVSEDLAQLGRNLEAHFSNTRQVQRLLRTQPPSWDAYRLKAEIAIKENVASEAAPWLARDVNLLIGPVTVAKEA